MSNRPGDPFPITGTASISPTTGKPLAMGAIPLRKDDGGDPRRALRNAIASAQRARSAVDRQHEAVARAEELVAAAAERLAAATTDGP
jgi:hypothetical protein